MKHQALRVLRAFRPLVWSAACLALAGSLVLAPSLFAQEAPQTPEAPQTATAPAKPDPPPPGTAAQRVYLDPATGRLVAEPPPGTRVLRLSPRELRWLSTSHDGLTQRARAGGGYWLDPQGRFRHLAVATIQPDGQITVRDVVGDAEAPDERPDGSAEAPPTPPEPSASEDGEPEETP